MSGAINLLRVTKAKAECVVVWRKLSPYEHVYKEHILYLWLLPVIKPMRSFSLRRFCLMLKSGLAFIFHSTTEVNTHTSNTHINLSIDIISATSFSLAAQHRDCLAYMQKRAIKGKVCSFFYQCCRHIMRSVLVRLFLVLTWKHVPILSQKLRKLKRGLGATFDLKERNV